VSRFCLLYLLLLVILAPGLARADAIVVTRAMLATTILEYYVTLDSVRVELEIGAGDLDAFRNLMPDEIYEQLGHEPEPYIDRLQRFLEEDFLILDAHEQPLRGIPLNLQIRPRVKRDEITGLPLPADPDNQEVVFFAVLGYALPERPTSLTLQAPRRHDGGVVTASIGFVLYHQGLPVNDFRYLGGRETVDLDWEDPWYSRFRNRNLRRQYDAPLNVFLYVEPYEVRVEIIARPSDLQRWRDFGLATADTIAAAAQESLLTQVGNFLAENFELTVENRTVTPTLDRINFLHRTLRNSTVVDPPEPLPKVSATLGAIYVHPTGGLPEQAAVTWKLFHPRIEYVYTAATDEAGPLPGRLSPDDNVLLWQNFLTNPTLPTLVQIPPPPRMGRLHLPVASLILLGGLAWLLVRRRRRAGPRPRWWFVALGGLLIGVVLLAPVIRVAVPFPLSSSTDLTAVDTDGVVSGLLTNVYRAFDFRDEEAIYDTLARSASGDLLTRIYLETRRSLELQSQGGARVKVKEVSLAEVVPSSLSGTAGFDARCKWNVAGSVGHWGHIHQRVNQYDAVLRIEPVDGVWKITGLELLQEERVS
jgi:hypothetical protein